MAPPYSEDKLRILLDGYRVVRELGGGSFGTVLECADPSDRRVAVKVLTWPLDDPGGVASRLARESGLLSGLAHPHIVEFVAFVRRDDLGMAVIIMELAEGDLRRLIRTVGSFGPRTACAIAIAVAAGLGHLHEQGVLHRDMKPENILITEDGKPEIADFGLARLLLGNAVHPTDPIGTSVYMAPEQFDASAELTTAADVYALGIVLYEMLSGRPPFPGDEQNPQSRETLRDAHRHRTPARLPDRVPPAIAEIVMTCLAKAPSARRYTDGWALFAALAGAARAEFGDGWLDEIDVALAPDVRDAALGSGLARSGAPSRSGWVPGVDLFAIPTRPPTRPPVLTLPPPRLPHPPDRSSHADDLATMPTMVPIGGAGGVTAAFPRIASPRGGSARPALLPRRVGEAGRKGAAGERAAVFSPDGGILATAGVDRTIRLWGIDDPAHPRQLGPVLSGHKHWVLGLAYSPAEPILASASNDGTVRLWDVRDPERAGPIGRPIPCGGTATWVAFNPEGTVLLAPHGHAVGQWDVRDPGQPRLLGVFGGSPRSDGENLDWVWRVAVGRAIEDGYLVATAGAGRAAGLWAVTGPGTARPLGELLPGLAARVDALAFGADGSTLMAAGPDRTMRLWDVTDPYRVRPGGSPPGHPTGVTAAAPGPDGRVMVTAEADRTLRVWDIGDPAHPTMVGGRPAGHTRRVNAVVFHPTRGLFATAADDGVVRLWALAPSPGQAERVERVERVGEHRLRRTPRNTDRARGIGRLTAAVRGR